MLKIENHGKNYPPIHANDRCTTVAEFDDDIVEDLQRRARDEDGESILVSQDMSYDEWYNKNVDNQEKIGYNVNYIRKNQYTKNKNLDSEIKK